MVGIDGLVSTGGLHSPGWMPRTYHIQGVVGALDNLVMRFVGVVVWLLLLVFTWESFCECV